MIRWRSEQDWKEIPEARLEDLERQFRERMPEGHERVEMRAYEVRGGKLAGEDEPGAA